MISRSFDLYIFSMGVYPITETDNFTQLIFSLPEVALQNLIGSESSILILYSYSLESNLLRKPTGSFKRIGILIFTLILNQVLLKLILIDEKLLRSTCCQKKS